MLDLYHELSNNFSLIRIYPFYLFSFFLLFTFFNRLVTMLRLISLYFDWLLFN